ncbi:putative trancriptional regulator, ArsR family [Halalkaliarchaeum sp. AArc-CO]|uniref:DUF7344 domain-containing protein n=1 Tax=Halalkaliarchaeum sp. AArc-CO TaxID=2866381 RepID=UPI00217D5EFD|nr:hypothetical protein [Halalkaliarchaeum sp. AArc-CO]UWG50088.1 putative trancriptional regulator, ArsR family [Halalkaliarchaeum sp. AArc-CO]
MRGSSSEATGGQLLQRDKRQRQDTQDVYELLRNERRRYALHALSVADGPVSVGDLADRVAAWEHDTTVEQITERERHRVYTSLQQVHLPRLDEADLVRFDEDQGVVDPSPGIETYDVYLDVVGAEEISWSGYYLGLSLVTLAVFVLVSLELYPFTLLPVEAWVAGVVVGFLGSAVIHVWSVRRTTGGFARLRADGDAG